MREHNERDFVLIDVRQPEEYAADHVPGAKLMPLLDLETRSGEVTNAPEQAKIFYCRTGGRSSRAANYFASALSVPNVFNLEGGMLGWIGERLPDFPNVKAFDEKASVREVLLQAMNLEKGADRLYDALLAHFRGTTVGPTIEMLARAEVAHGRAVYAALLKLGEEHLADFETLYASLQGELLESGATFAQAVQLARSSASHGTAALLELALDIELKAYDLYRSLAHQAKTDELRETFLDLAGQEKRHASSLLKAIGRAAAA
ncbi:MAG: rhodanese-like domain-containing protein [Polyangiaceae bacterium]|nr:rhodanese-like domain-containing protein [Polyangiaceae bacterium]